MKKRILSISVLILVVSVILFFSIVIGFKEYRKFTFLNAFSDFSFEYPRFHHVISTNGAFDGSPIASVFIALIQIKAPQDEYIDISIRETSATFPSYNVLLEHNLNVAQKGQGADEFKLLERTGIIIDGVAGEKIAYSYYRHPEAVFKNNQFIKPAPIPAISFVSCFEKNGFIWEINVEAIANRSEKAKADFEHIISSFKFLK